MSAGSYVLWPDEKLLELLQADDRVAFEIIYQRYWSKLYLSAYSILRDQQAAEDIVQEIFVQLWINRGSQRIETLKSYLFTAIRFQVFKAIRNQKVRADLLKQVEAIDFSDATQEHVIENEINALVEKSILELPEKCRQIFILSRREFLSVKEIAERLNLSPKTVENQITIAIRKLRLSLGELLYFAAFALAYTWRI